MTFPGFLLLIAAVAACCAVMFLVIEVRGLNSELRDAEDHISELIAGRQPTAPFFPFATGRFFFTDAEVDARCADLEQFLDQAGDDR